MAAGVHGIGAAGGGRNVPGSVPAGPGPSNRKGPVTEGSSSDSRGHGSSKAVLHNRDEELRDPDFRREYVRP